MKGIHCAFVATLAREPELKTAATGRQWLSLGAFAGEGDDAQYVQIGYFSHPEEISEQLHKGDAIYCEGKVKLRSWDAPDGERKSCLSVAASLIQPLGLIGQRKPKKAKAEKSKSVQAAELPLQVAPGPPAATPVTGGRGGGKVHDRPFDDPIPF